MKRLLLVVTAALASAAPALAGPRVEVVLVPRLDLSQYASRGAVGLLVPGAGSKVTGARALASLERGRMRTSLLGGLPGGPVLVRPSTQPGEITFYVSLPGPGTHPNVRRYPLAVVGGGYHGMLTSSNTRIPGLVSVADVAPSVVALREGRRPAIRSRASATAVADVRRLDERLADAHDARGWANVVLVALTGGFAAVALAVRSPLLSRAGLLAAPALLVAALGLAAVGGTRPTAAVLAVAAAAAGLAAAGAAASRERRVLGAVLLVVFPVELAVLALWPDVNALAVLGPHPDGGGRFYGVTNQVESLLLVPALLAPALLGRAWLAPAALLAFLTVGASATGADGGGGVVLAAGYLTLGLRLYGARLTVPRVAAIAAAAAVAGLALVGIDAAAGGSSHVTRAVRGGPGSLAGDVGHRLHVSAAGAVASFTAFVLFAIGCALLAWLAVRGPRTAVLEALLVALGASLLVNDSPSDVAFYGALGAAALSVWTRVSDVERALSPPGRAGARG